MNTHRQHGHQQQPRKVRPIRVAARRQRELMVVVREGMELEWLDEEDVDSAGLAVPPQPQCPIPSILSVDDINPWQKCE
ncbi:Uncharacterised protein r2_g2499 [Pycnogonum litorale]